MALLFPSKDDAIKLRAYAEVHFDEPHFFREVRKVYENLRERMIKYRSQTLEEKLIELAQEWADAKTNKKKKGINLHALTLIKGCCQCYGGLTEKAKGYYRTYYNLRRIIAGEKQFYLG